MLLVYSLCQNFWWIKMYIKGLLLRWVRGRKGEGGEGEREVEGGKWTHEKCPSDAGGGNWQCMWLRKLGPQFTHPSAGPQVCNLSIVLPVWKVCDVDCAGVWCVLGWTTESLGHRSCWTDCLFPALLRSQGRCFWTESGLFQCSLISSLYAVTLHWYYSVLRCVQKPELLSATLASCYSC